MAVDWKGIISYVTYDMYFFTISTNFCSLVSWVSSRQDHHIASQMLFYQNTSLLLISYNNRCRLTFEIHSDMSLKEMVFLLTYWKIFLAQMHINLRQRWIVFQLKITLVRKVFQIKVYRRNIHPDLAFNCSPRVTQCQHMSYVTYDMSNISEYKRYKINLKVQQ